jgi:hypothetical protein
LAAEKTGHVLVRTRPHPGARKPQRFQSLTLAMSGGLKLDRHSRGSAGSLLFVDCSWVAV